MSKASHGCSYADSWGSIPFQRMPNVSLEPGKLADIVADGHRAREVVELSFVHL